MVQDVLTAAQLEVCSLYHRGLSLAEIADLTHRAENTVKKLRFRAKRRILAAGLTWPRRPAGVRGSHTYSASPLIDAA